MIAKLVICIDCEQGAVKAVSFNLMFKIIIV